MHLLFNFFIHSALTGETFVISGVTRIGREDLTEILKGYGAKVTGSVSGKTTYLVVGDILEDGRQVYEGNKYKKASELNKKIVNFDELQNLIREKLGDPEIDLENINWKKTLSSDLLTKEVNQTNASKNKGKSLSFLKPENDAASTSGKMEIDDELKMKQDHNNIKNNNLLNNNIDRVPKAIQLALESNNDLWTNKYNPKSIQEIIGNQANVKKITQWLQDWHDVNILGNKKDFHGTYNRFRNENPNCKAMLISGDPGIGKTSTVRLLAKLLDFKPFELNASDQRNKKIILNKVGYLMDNTTLEGTKDEKINQKNLIVMDEIDGIAGNEDRGGIAALIQIIKETKTPIICICNDRQSQKLKSLANYCYDIRFSKPDKRQMTKRLMEICAMEGIKAEEAAIENLCEVVGNDIRQSLNFIQFWSRKSKQLKICDMTNTFNKYNKDNIVMINHFEGVTKLLTRQSFSMMNFRDKLNMFFLDYDLVPLLVQENYLGCYKEKSISSLQKIYKSADHISFSDILDKKIRSQNNWNLLQDKGIHSCVAVGEYSANALGFPKFPE